MPNVTGVTVISTESLDALTRERDELRADVEFWQKRAEIEGEATMNAVTAAEELRRAVELNERSTRIHQLALAEARDQAERLRAALNKIADDSSHADQYVKWAQEALDRASCC